MSDLESKMNEALSGKFFWEPTVELEGCREPEILQIRKAQKAFASPGSKTVTIRSGRGDPKAKDSVHHISRLAEAIAKAHHCGVFELIEKSHLKRLSAPKQHYNWGLLRYYPTYSVSRLARIIERDHATIVHGAKRFEHVLDKYAEQIRAVDEIMWSK